jgi:hypothetical protein
MPFQVSPGISASEIDLTAGARSVNASDAGFAAPFQWGPAAIVQNIDSEDAWSRRSASRTTSRHHTGSLHSHSLHIRAFSACVRVLAAPALNATPSAKTLTGTVTSGTAPTRCSRMRRRLRRRLARRRDRRCSSVQRPTSSTPSSTPPHSRRRQSSRPTSRRTRLRPTACSSRIRRTTRQLPAAQRDYGALGAKWAGELGNSLKVSTCASANAFQSSPSGSSP